MNQQTDQHLSWSDQPDHPVPNDVLEHARRGTLTGELEALNVRLHVRRLPERHAVPFHAHLGDSLLRVYEKAAEALGEPLLPPPPLPPLDLLLFHTKAGEWKPVAVALDAPLWLALLEGLTRHLGIDYQLVVRINTRWGRTTSDHLTPKQLLAEFGFNPAEFSLYRRDSNEPLPPDTPLHLHRGEHFEAQKDGRYGGTASPSVRGLQRIEDDVEQLIQAGERVRLVSNGTQRYVEISVSIPSPPWSAPTAEILIAVPANYPQGGLDAFYLRTGVTRDGSVPCAARVEQLNGGNWTLISWHYSSGRPWNPSVDDLQSHVAHCKGFFLQRGVVAQ